MNSFEIIIVFVVAIVIIVGGRGRVRHAE